jgi:hypothetical protein
MWLNYLYAGVMSGDTSQRLIQDGKCLTHLRLTHIAGWAHMNSIEIHKGNHSGFLARRHQFTHRRA